MNENDGKTEMMTMMDDSIDDVIKRILLMGVMLVMSM